MDVLPQKVEEIMKISQQSVSLESALHSENNSAFDEFLQYQDTSLVSDVSEVDLVLVKQPSPFQQRL